LIWNLLAIYFNIWKASGKPPNEKTQHTSYTHTHTHTNTPLERYIYMLIYLGHSLYLKFSLCRKFMEHTVIRNLFYQRGKESFRYEKTLTCCICRFNTCLPLKKLKNHHEKEHLKQMPSFPRLCQSSSNKLITNYRTKKTAKINNFCQLKVNQVYLLRRGKIMVIPKVL
jgi:hypothetical protein